MQVQAVGNSEDVKYIFEIMGLDYLDISQLDSINTTDTCIIMYDINSDCPLDIVDKIKRMGIGFIYFFNKKNNNLLRHLINNGFYNLHMLTNKITIDDILQATEIQKTYEDVAIFLDKEIEIKNFNDIVEVLDRFLHAIENCDEETLENIYQSSFNKLLTFKESINDILIANGDMTRKLAEISKQLEIAEQKYTDLTSRHDRLILAGRDTESKNKELTQTLAELNQEFNAKTEILTKCDVEIRTQSQKINQLESDKVSLQDSVKNLENERNTLKIKNDRTLKELELLRATVNSSKKSIEDIQINVLNTGKVQKYLYFKVYDMVTGLVGYLEKYPKHVENKLGVNGCSILVICPKESSLSTILSKKYKDVMDVKEDRIEKGIYVINGYTEKIEDIISRLDSQILIILDLTLRSKLLCNSIRQKNIYVVDTPETITFNRLNPADCFSSCDLSSEGAVTRLPIIPENTSAMSALKLITNTLYTILDTYWR